MVDTRLAEGLKGMKNTGKLKESFKCSTHHCPNVSCVQTTRTEIGKSMRQLVDDVEAVRVHIGLYLVHNN